jgi:hypothetical protein
MDRCNIYSVQIGAVQNLIFKKLDVRVRVLILPSVSVLIWILGSALIMKDPVGWIEYFGFVLLTVTNLGFIILLWAQSIEIGRYNRCIGDSDLYFEGDQFVFYKQIRKKLTFVKFSLKDIEEFQLSDENSRINIKTKSNIFKQRNGNFDDKISLDYIGDLSAALMISEKIQIANMPDQNSSQDDKMIGLLNDIMRELQGIRLQNMPITDLKKNISLNQRFNFYKGLFNSDNEKYELTIEQLNNSSKSEAFALLKSLGEEFRWSSNSSLVFEFTQLVIRRFL